MLLLLFKILGLIRRNSFPSEIENGKIKVHTFVLGLKTDGGFTIYIS